MALRQRLKRLERSLAERPCLQCLHPLTMIPWDPREPYPENPGRCLHCGRTWECRIFAFASGRVPVWIRQRYQPLAAGGSKERPMNRRTP
jgi:hypothetical protein